MNIYSDIVPFEKSYAYFGVAGCGKTTLLLAEVNHLFKKKEIPLDKIAILSFSNKAIEEIKERLRVSLCYEDGKLVNKNLYDKWKMNTKNINTLHSACMKIVVEDYKNVFSYENNRIKRITNSIRQDIENNVKKMQETNNNIGLADYIKDINPVDLINGIIDAEINRKYCNGFVKNIEKHLESIYFSYEQCTGRRKDSFLSIIKEYKEILKSEKIFTFGMLLEYAYLHAEGKRVDSDIEYILLDECQDITPLQFSLLKKLYPNARSIFLFGDIYQSIYTFAGVDSEYIKIIYQNVKKLKLKTISYRYGGDLLPIANRLLKRCGAFYLIEENKNKKINTKVHHTFNLINETIRLHNKGKSTTILFRANFLLNNFKEELERKRIPFSSFSIIKEEGIFIKLSTIHRFKGGEDDVIILDTTTTKKISNSYKRELENDEYNELMLWYVAVTRAKKELYIYDDINAFYKMENL